MKYLLFPLLLCSLIISLTADESPSVFKNLDVFELEYASDPRISPDSKTIVYIRNGMDIMKEHIETEHMGIKKQPEKPEIPKKTCPFCFQLFPMDIWAALAISLFLSCFSA